MMDFIKTISFVLVLGNIVSGTYAEPLYQFSIQEPLEQNWVDEWLTWEIPIEHFDSRNNPNPPQVFVEGKSVPSQFYNKTTQQIIKKFNALPAADYIEVLFQCSLPKNETITVTLADKQDTNWTPLHISNHDKIITVENSYYSLTFDTKKPLPFNKISGNKEQTSLAHCAWPDDVKVTGVENTWIEQGPARAILMRVFQFQNPQHHYAMRITFWANDPFIEISDQYSLGQDSYILFDMRPYNASTVYHPYTYNARTFRAGGEHEDSTIQPPQHPIATLGPIWRDIWYNGGPFAFIYRDDAANGLGFAAIKGSLWKVPQGITPESQNLFVHGDKVKEGQVQIHLPTEGGERYWGLVVGPPSTRRAMSRMVRSHADIPLNRVLHEWVLDWESDAPLFSTPWASTYLGAHYNRHSLNPTTFPRRVDKSLPEKGPVKSRDLAVLAYIFTDPNYWPGPSYPWEIGNPNFHTDMYSIPLKIGLLMPDHPSAKDWVQFGMDETHGDLIRNSYPGGAWQESLSYSEYFFHVAHNAALIQQSGLMTPFADWPRLKDVSTYLATMHTPWDPRYGERQIAPIGDTSPKDYIDKIHTVGSYYKGIDDDFSQKLLQFPKPSPQALSLHSREFPGFGAMLRGNQYDKKRESFVTVKAGPARNHYQRDELSFTFHSISTPLAIDYACHYSPRPWSAAMHNRPDMDNLSPLAVAKPVAMNTSPVADLFVAEEQTNLFRAVPILPHETIKPGWEYPTQERENELWWMRRYTLLVKHENDSAIPDYLVIADTIDSPDPIWWNLHVLARSQNQEANTIFFDGQLDVDLTAHFLLQDQVQIQSREWGWKNYDSGKRRTLKGQEYEDEFFGAYIPKDFVTGTWGQDKNLSGEMAQWLRVRGSAGKSQWLVVLMPTHKGEQAPEVTSLSPTSFRVQLGAETETIHLGDQATYAAAVIRNGKKTVLLEKNP